MWYADGSALLQFFAADAEWLAFVESQDIAVSEISTTEFHAGAVGYDTQQRSAALDWLGGFDQLRIPDQALGVAAMSTTVLQPLAAIHLGVVVSVKGIGGLITFDQRLAAVAHLHRIKVCTPGRVANWWESGTTTAQGMPQ